MVSLLTFLKMSLEKKQWSRVWLTSFYWNRTWSEHHRYHGYSNQLCTTQWWHTLMGHWYSLISTCEVTWLGSLVAIGRWTGDLTVSSSIPSRRRLYWDGWPSSGWQATSVFHRATQANSASYPHRDRKRVPTKVRRYALRLRFKGRIFLSICG